MSGTLTSAHAAEGGVQASRPPAVVVGVVGAGAMGAGIAQVAAQAGHQVWLLDVRPEAAAIAIGQIRADLQRQVVRGRLTAIQADATGQRLHVAPDLSALAHAGLVVEAIAELLDAKRDLFRRLEAVVPERTLLATNTSSISVSSIAQALQHPGRVAGMHFFNPATRLKLVEVIRGVATSDETVQALHDLAHRWGKVSIDAPNAPGFIVNRAARPYYAEAMRLLAERIAVPQDIDAILRDGAGFAMGPFELIDLIGTDVNLAVTESVFAATGFDRRYAPHLIQQELVRAGRLGRKAGSGFYSYAAGAGRPETTLVTPAPKLPTLRVPVRPGLLQPLLERVARAGVPMSEDPGLPDATLAVDDVLLALTDGRTAAERACTAGRAVLLLDLCADFATSSLFAACASPGAEACLAGLAALLQALGVRLVPLADVAGLVAMRTVACLANEAADLVTWSGARVADIDTAMCLGTSYPRGPLAWADLLGAATLRELLANLRGHYGEERYRCSPALTRSHFTGVPFHA